MQISDVSGVKTAIILVEFLIDQNEINQTILTINYSLPVWPRQTSGFFCVRDAHGSKCPSDKIVHSMVPGRSARRSFRDKAVEAMCVNQWTATAWIRDAQWQAQSQGDSSPYRLVVKLQAARRDRQGEKPTAAMRWRRGQKGGRLRWPAETGLDHRFVFREAQSLCVNSAPCGRLSWPMLAYE